jgi:hypothetical protein
MDEYTGLLIDQLVHHPYSRLIVAGREAVDENLLRACEAVAQEPNSSQSTSLVQQAARSWAARITLPAELRAFRNQYVDPLSRLIRNGKVVIYESLSQQGQDFSMDLESLLQRIGARGLAQEHRAGLQQQLEPLLAQARQVAGQSRDESLQRMTQIVSVVHLINGFQLIHSRSLDISITSHHQDNMNPL